MMVARRTLGAGVRKPPREETAGFRARWRVSRYGDLDAGGLFGTFRKCRSVRLESGMRTKADRPPTTLNFAPPFIIRPRAAQASGERLSALQSLDQVKNRAHPVFRGVGSKVYTVLYGLDPCQAFERPALEVWDTA